MSVHALRRIPFVPVAIAALLIGGVALAAASSTAPAASTQKDLSEAMHVEAFAYLTYLAYADAARAHGNVELAKLFEKTANTERTSRYAGHAAFSELVKSNAANLEAAIWGQNHENTVMYPAMAKRAAANGDASRSLVRGGRTRRRSAS